MGVIGTTERWWRPIRERIADLGYTSSPDDCYLALRGLRTLPTRLRYQEKSALEIAQWLQRQPLVREVLYPALSDDPGHVIWKRDFSGASSLFGVTLNCDSASVPIFIESLSLFGIGASWGGFESLVLPAIYTRSVESSPRPDASLRLYIGLEAPDDLIADLDAALNCLSGSRPTAAQP